MGKRGFNRRARQVAQVVIDDTETKNISLDFEDKGHYDASNELVIPSKKRKTSIKKKKVEVVRLLSRKHRKKLERIVEEKNKKDKRSNILEELQKVQISNEERNKLTSLTSVRTKGRKNKFKEAKIAKKQANLKTEEFKIHDSTDELVVVEVVEDFKKENCALIKQKTDLNTVGFDNSSDSDVSIDEPEVPNKKLKLTSDKENDSKLEENEREKQNQTEINKVSTQQKIQSKPAVYVDVIRNADIQKSRLKLPILAEEQEIMETVNSSSVVIITGETGSGKTTQIPQFLYEAGYALQKQIVVTEPRRLAAISMSERVAKELNLSFQEVSFLIRYQGNAGDNTKIKFVTDGVLLKELETDFLLSKYSVVILDEAHERSLYTDILLGFLSRIIKVRQKRNDPLKLIIMSATLCLEVFTKNQRLFSIPPPVINVKARQFPVEVHFNKQTNENYIEVAFRKTIKIHTTLPDGGILIFVTGQREVNYLVRNLRKKFPYKGETAFGKHRKQGKRRKTLVLPEINLDDYSLPRDVEHSSDSEELHSESDIEETSEATYQSRQPLWVLPLYSLLNVKEQNMVFQPPPPGCRLCVVSTNVAEASLTIPGIKYVVDSGKTKMKMYDKVTGVSRFDICWTSKASADQRAGRAGRTGPGHCYRLYSSAVFNDVFPKFDEPEIRRVPIDDLYLRMRSMCIEKIINFPFPTAPDLLQLKTAETRLKALGILDGSGKLTNLGKAVSKFPVSPRYGKMLALSHQQNMMPYTVCLVAGLSVPQVLLEDMTNGSDKWSPTRLRWAGVGNSYLLGDNMVLLKAIGAAEFADSQRTLDQFCSENGVCQKAVTEARQLRIQLSRDITANIPDVDLVVDPKMVPPNDLQAKLLRQILLSGLGDQIAKKMTPDEVPTGENKGKYKYAYHANNMEDLVFLHRGSVMAKKLPEFVVYQDLHERNKIYMRGVTAIEPEWLPIYVPSLCNLGAPLTDPPPTFTDGKVMCTMKGTFGSQGWCLPLIRLEYPESEDAYRLFAKFLLEGEVINELKRFTPSLLSQPLIMTKTWAKLQPRTQSLLNALLSRSIRTKQTLLDEWEKNPKFLLSEYLQWMPQSGHTAVTVIWPPK